MDTEALELDASLGSHLVKLLLDHGVQASHDAGLVLVGPDNSRWARLTATRESGSSSLQLHIDAAAPSDAILSDSLNGFGTETGLALGDALQHFCLGDFHVLLAGLWGLLEEDQVDHYTASAENGEWDLYLGAWVSRMSDPTNAMRAPETTFAKALIEAAPKVLTERRPHAGRVFLGVLDGELTYEALLDMRPSDELDKVLRSVPLKLPPEGYASQRLFFLAMPRDVGPAHARVGRCTPPNPAAPGAMSRSMRDIWIALAASVLLIAIAYALHR